MKKGFSTILYLIFEIRVLSRLLQLVLLYSIAEFYHYDMITVDLNVFGQICAQLHSLDALPSPGSRVARGA